MYRTHWKSGSVIARQARSEVPEATAALRYIPADCTHAMGTPLLSVHNVLEAPNTPTADALHGVIVLAVVVRS